MVSSSRSGPKPGGMRDSMLNSSQTLPAQRRGLGSGFLLMEVILGLLLGAMLMTGVMMVASGTLRFSQVIIEDGKEQNTREAFISFIGRNLEALPGNAVLDLQTWDDGNRFQSAITIQNAPTSFSWPGDSSAAEAIELVTQANQFGTIDLFIRYWDAPILEDTLDPNRDASLIGEIPLLQDVYYLEWYPLDRRELRYNEEGIWDVRSQLPLQIKLKLRMHADAPEIVHNFWIPQKANPESIVRSQRLNAPGQRAGQGGDGQAGRGRGDGRDGRGGDRRRGGGTGGGGDRPPQPRVTPPTPR